MQKTQSLILAILFTAGTLLSGIVPSYASELQLKEYLVTAYYSPVPDQQFYMTGSYKGDIRLNGGGVRASDGTAPYNGMMAAPKTYSFGTQLHCPGFGTGVVHDRGGAILSAGNRGFMHDRLDIYFGKGEEGLASALEFGLQVKKCAITNNPDLRAGFNIPTAGTFTKMKLAARQNAFNLAKAPLYQEYFQRLKLLNYGTSKDDLMEFQLTHNVISSQNDPCAGCMGPGTRKKLDELFTKINTKVPKLGLYEDEEGDEVQKLQQLLYETGYLTVKPTGYFGEQTTEALIQLQLDNNLIDSVSHRAAGYVGPGTVQILSTLAAKQFAKADSSEKPEHRVDLAKALSAELEVIYASQKATEPEPEFTNNLALDDKGNEVTELQTFLYETGYLDETPTGYYGWDTARAVLNFQLKNRIVSSYKDIGAGVLGPTTRKLINEQFTKTPRIRVSGQVI